MPWFKTGFNLSIGTNDSRGVPRDNSNNNPPPAPPPNDPVPNADPDPIAPEPVAPPTPPAGPGPCSPGNLPDGDSEIGKSAVGSNFRFPSVEAVAMVEGQKPPATGTGSGPTDQASSAPVSASQPAATEGGPQVPGKMDNMNVQGSDLEGLSSAGNPGNESVGLNQSKKPASTSTSPVANQPCENGRSPAFFRRIFRIGTNNAETQQHPSVPPGVKNVGMQAGCKRSQEVASLTSPVENDKKRSKSDVKFIFSSGNKADEASDVQTTESDEDEGGDEATAPAPGDRGFVVSDANMRTTPDAIQINQQIIDSGNYKVEDLVVEHTEHGKIRFIGFLDLRTFGDFVDISKMVHFQHGGVTVKTPKGMPMPTNHLQITLYKITRQDFARQMGLTREISDEELKEIQNNLTVINEAFSHQYDPDEERWVLITQAPATKSGTGGASE